MANQKVEPGSSAGRRGSCIPASRPPAPGRSLAYLQDVDVERVRNIGPRQAGMLANSGIHSVADLLQHFPHRYLDRSLVVPIAGLPVDAEATLIAEVVRSFRPRVSGRRGPREMLRVTVQDSHLPGSGSERGLGPDPADGDHLLQPAFPRSPTPAGDRGRLLGEGDHLSRSSPNDQSSDVEMISSDEESFEGKIVPVHSAVGEMTPVRIRAAVGNALRRARPILDPVPPSVLRTGGLMERDQAFANIHFPQSMDHASEARRRLVFDELFRIQVALALTRHRLVEEQEGIPQQLDCQLVTDFLDGLPYDLTGAQKRVLGEIGEDLEGRRPHAPAAPGRGGVGQDGGGARRPSGGGGIGEPGGDHGADRSACRATLSGAPGDAQPRRALPAGGPPPGGGTSHGIPLPGRREGRGGGWRFSPPPGRLPTT